LRYVILILLAALACAATPVASITSSADFDLSLRLVNGFISFTLAPSSALSVFSGNTLVQAQSGVTTTASAGGAATNPLPLPPGLPPSIS